MCATKLLHIISLPTCGHGHTQRYSLMITRTRARQGFACPQAQAHALLNTWHPIANLRACPDLVGLTTSSEHAALEHGTPLTPAAHFRSGTCGCTFVLVVIARNSDNKLQSVVVQFGPGFGQQAKLATRSLNSLTTLCRWHLYSTPRPAGDRSTSQARKIRTCSGRM